MADARRALVITGAGLSADSGLPTYRGIGGLYNGDTDEGVPIEVALSGHALRQNPALCWKYLHQIGDACRQAGPNDGHRALVRLERHFDHLCVLTQNVDGFHRQAGSSDVIEIHGNLEALLCMACPWRLDHVGGTELAPVPLCPACGSVLRPNVVLFGEMLPDPAVLRYEQAMSAGFDVVLSIGTTSVFPYIAGPVQVAAQQGLPTVEINPGTSEVSDVVRWRIRVGAAQALVELASRLDGIAVAQGR
jgi:NAD-dependent deacetylase